MQKIHPFLWIEKSAEEAVAFYASVFGDALKTLEASERLARFELDGSEYVLFNGGPHYALTPAFSMFIDCADQSEVDRFWDALSAGGEPLRCGWVNDRYGVCWQVCPSMLPAYLDDPDEAASKRVMDVMLGMIKLDIAELERAHRGPAAATSQ